jgi:hypothetical protein
MSAAPRETRDSRITLNSESLVQCALTVTDHGSAQQPECRKYLHMYLLRSWGEVKAVALFHFAPQAQG